MSFLGGLFGKKKTPEEMMREYKRSIDRTCRDLDRERMKMEGQEKKLIADMKKQAKQGQNEVVRIQAKDLVRTRQYCRKFIKMRAQMQGVALKIQTMSSTAHMAEAMKGVTMAMRKMNQKMNLPAMQQIMMEFQRQNEMMEMKGDMMEDAIDDAMDSGDEEEETDALVKTVMDELGLEMKEQLDVKTGPIGDQQAAAASQEDDDLQARLDKLRKS
eukprot:TRINITY_DN18386_c0_g1_i1.p1 TRINITY_DN18386_c0_g1~~TRINITY_DN18386_c0_g1_i1.p1  ORF type:complete len:244 (+),score=136.60 TRINITY_DN18386_c0_g1_i1:88-732(+)